MKKTLSLLCGLPQRAIFDRWPPAGITHPSSMAHRTGHNRQQFGLFATPLDEMIAPDNPVRVVEVV